MALSNIFVALVTLAPELPSKKTYVLKPVTAFHGETPDEITRSLDAQGHLGYAFEAAGDVDAQVIVDTVLPHPAEVGSFSFLTNDQLNVRQGARDLV